MPLQSGLCHGGWGRRAGLIASTLFLFGAVAAWRVWSQAAQPITGVPAPAGFRSDRLLIKPKPNVALAAMAHLHASFGTQPLRSFPAIENLQILQLPPGANLQALMAAYRQSGLVEYAEADYLVQPLLVPNDFRYWDGSLWGLENTGNYGGVPHADIHAQDGWDLQHTATNILVAVIDSGVRYTHEDLAKNMWINPGETGLDARGRNKATNHQDDDYDGWVDDVYGIDALSADGDPMDTLGHGTHVAGIIGAVGSNSVGVVGVAWRVPIMACRFLNTLGADAGSVADAITCIDYARSKGAKIINASWGGYAFTSQALYDAIRSTRDAGMIFVAATGNDADDNDARPLYPASYDLDNIVAVAATTRTDDLASWSNFGATSVDLGAPGLDIFGCWNSSNSAYQWFSGTSMAAAHVSGACAVVWAHYPNENYRQIINRVLSGVDPLPALAGKCVTGGRLNLFKALSGVAPGSLAVFPTNQLSAIGIQGGPFNPSNFVCTLTNSGGSALDWSIISTQDWVSVSITNGTLAAAAATNVEFSINANAQLMPPDSYTNIVR